MKSKWARSESKERSHQRDTDMVNRGHKHTPFDVSKVKTHEIGAIDLLPRNWIDDRG